MILLSVRTSVAEKLCRREVILYFSFCLLAHWCSSFIESCLQSTCEMSLFRCCKIKYKQAHTSTSGRFYKHFPPQKPSFALPQGPELLMTFEGYFCERTKLLASSWTNELHHDVTRNVSSSCPFSSDCVPLFTNVFSSSYISLSISQHPRCRRMFSPSGSCLRMFCWAQHTEQVVKRASSVKVLICF